MGPVVLKAAQQTNGLKLNSGQQLLFTFKLAVTEESRDICLVKRVALLEYATGTTSFLISRPPPGVTITLVTQGGPDGFSFPVNDPEGSEPRAAVSSRWRACLARCLSPHLEPAIVVLGPSHIFATNRLRVRCTHSRRSAAAMATILKLLFNL